MKRLLSYVSALALAVAQASSALAGSNAVLQGPDGGTGLTSFSRHGNTTIFQTETGATTSGHVPMFDASGNIVDSGFTPASGGTAGLVFNIVDYGDATTCKTATDDTAALNAVWAAAVAWSNANRRTAKIVGLMGNLSPNGCQIVAGNLTHYRPPGDGRTIIIDDITITCKNTAAPSSANNYGICLDFTDTGWITFGYGVVIKGNAAIAVQLGSQHGHLVAGCGGINWYGTKILGNWGIAAIANDQCEVQNMYGLYAQNNVAGTVGSPIAAYLGTTSLVGGTGGADGVYTNVTLTGGVSTSPAIATVTVAGGVVTDVYLTYQGKEYVVGNVLSAASGDIGGVTGFSITVNNIAPMVIALDGQNYWRFRSVYAPIDAPIASYGTQTGIHIDGGSFNFNTSSLTGVAIWVSYAQAAKIDSYTNVFNTNAPNIVIFDNSAGPASAQSDMNINVRFENNNKRTSLLFDGSNPTPTYTGFTYRNQADGDQHAFAFGSKITLLTMEAASILIPFGILTSVFEDPSKLSYAGTVDIYRSTIWTAPSYFTGTVCDPSPCTIYPDGIKSDGSHSGFQVLNNFSGSGAVVDFDAPNIITSSAFNLRIGKSTHGNNDTLSIYVPDGTGTTVQTQFSGVLDTFLNNNTGCLKVGPNSTAATCTAGVKTKTIGGATQVETYTVSTLPTCTTGMAGAIAYVSDALAPAYNVALVGGGAVKTLAACDGVSTWTSH